MKKLRKPVQFQAAFFLCKFFFTCFACVELYYWSGFLTDVAQFPLELVALVVSVTGVVDTVFAFFAGWILEKVNMPWGKNRSWILIGPPIGAVLGTLIFTNIGEPIMAATIICVSYIISHLLWMIAESAYNATMVISTEDQEERMKLSIRNGQGSMGAGIIFGTVSMLLITNVGGATGDPTMGYIAASAVFGLCYVLSFWWIFFLTKGDEPTRKEAEAARAAGVAEENIEVAEKIPTKVMLQAVYKNKDLMILLIEETFARTCVFLFSSIAFYWFTYNLGSFEAMGDFMTFRGIAFLLGSFLTGFYVNKMFKGNKKRALIFVLGMTEIFHLVIFIIQPGLLAYEIIYLIAAFLFGCSAMMALAFFTDCSVKSQYLTGLPCHGFVMSLVQIPTKLALLFSKWIIVFGLIAIGYDAAAAAPTPEVLGGINFLTNLLPVIVTALFLIVFAVGYKLKESDVERMQNEMHGEGGAEPAAVAAGEDAADALEAVADVAAEVADKVDGE